METPKEIHDIFGHGKFDVEHALDIYATTYSTFPAELLYEQKWVDDVREMSDSFHIYIIGYTPKMEQKSVRSVGRDIYITVSYEGREVELKFMMPPGFKLVQSGANYHIEDPNGVRGWLPPSAIMKELNAAVGGCSFKVKYIGQAYGEDGERDAIDRLRKHETLQKIAIKGVPEGHMLQVVLIALQTANRIITVFLPNARNRDDDGARRQMGMDKMYGTTEAERVSLYEAALIRYFAPEFNKEFKNSFPSTNLSILQDCYRKDFLAVTAEICFDDMPFYLHSEAVKPKLYHIATHDLQNDAERRVFFGFSHS